MKKTLISLLAASLAVGALTLNAEITEPKLLEGEMPVYTNQARSQGIEGTIVVEALVDEHGRVFAAEVVQSLDPDLDARTLDAVRNWAFQPAMEDGEPVMQVVRIPVNFNLVDPAGDSLYRARKEALAARS
jgi:protein TonB